MTDNLYPKLLAPAQLGDILLENRVVMAPMTRSRAGEGDVATDLIAEYYGQRAGAGLIISEASQISPQGKGYPRTPGIFSAEQITGWRKVTERVHSEGGRIFLQLWHVGRLSHSSVQLGGQLPVAPSAIASDGQIYTPTGLQNFETPRALETTEIPAVVDDFRQAAVNAKEAGFDGVEIHAANGYIIDQFLRDGTNQRTDGYGGSIENRCRFLKEVVEAVIPVFGSGRTGVRLSPVFATFSMSDSDPAATFGYAAELLGKLGVAYLHVIQLGDEGFDYGALRAQFGGTYIANGGYSAQSAEQAIVSGEADFVAFGTPFIANPDLVARFRTNAELASFDPAFFYQGEEKGFTDYPPLASS